MVLCMQGFTNHPGQYSAVINAKAFRRKTVDGMEFDIEEQGDKPAQQHGHEACEDHEMIACHVLHGHAECYRGNHVEFLYCIHFNCSHCAVNLRILYSVELVIRRVCHPSDERIPETTLFHRMWIGWQVTELVVSQVHVRPLQRTPLPRQTRNNTQAKLHCTAGIERTMRKISMQAHRHGNTDQEDGVDGSEKQDWHPGNASADYTMCYHHKRDH